MKEIIFINGFQFGYQSDTYSYCQHLKDEFNFTCICFDDEKNKIFLPNVEVIYIKRKNRIVNKFNLLSTIIKEVMRRKKAVIFITCHFRFISIIPILFPFRKCIINFLTGSVSSNKFKNKFKNSNMWFESLFFKNKLVISPELRDRLHISKKARILPLGADIISDKDKNFDEIRLLYVGIIRGRNIHETIYGVAEFKLKHPDISIQYNIIGSGDASLIESEIQKYQLEDCVKVHGFIPREKIIYYYDISNIGVVYAPLTDYYKPQPSTKLNEYGLSGMASISIKIFDSVRRINENIGVLCDDNPSSFAIALEEIYINRKKYDSKVIRNEFSNFTMKNISQQFKNIIDEQFSKQSG